VGEAGRDTQVTFTFHEWASAKTTGLGAAQCLYRCSSVAQLNECGKARACGAATYSVNGTLLAPCATINTSSRAGNWGNSSRIGRPFTRKHVLETVAFSSESEKDDTHDYGVNHGR